MTLIQPNPSQLPLEGGERREPSQGEKAKGGDSGGREKRHRAAKQGEKGRKEGSQDGTPGPLSSFRHPKLHSNRILPHLLSFSPSLLSAHFSPSLPFSFSAFQPHSHLQLGVLGFVHRTGEEHHTRHHHLVVRFRGLELGCRAYVWIWLFPLFLLLGCGLWVLCFFRGGSIIILS